MVETQEAAIPATTNPKKEKKTFEEIDPKTGLPTGAKYTSGQPRSAALKSATAGNTDILLREVGTTKAEIAAVLHRFKGSRNQVEWPLPYPAHVKRAVEAKAGKSIPVEMNVKGGEKALKDAGFEPYLYWKPSVTKVLFEKKVNCQDGTVKTKNLTKIKVKKVPGKSVTEAVQEYVQSVGK